MVQTTTETRLFTAHIPIMLADKVDQFAHKLERSRGWVIKQALSAWIEQEERRNSLTWEALADVDNEKTIDQKFMQDWVDSLGTDNPLMPF